MLYSLYMKSSREYWPGWVETLHHYQLHELAASLLEAAGPLALLGAQILYFGRGLFENEQITALAQMLEEDGEVHAFASFLVQEKANQ